jgi:hypothetical protein
MLMKTQTKEATSVSQWYQGKYMSQFTLRSALVCIFWKILLFFNNFVVYTLLIMADSGNKIDFNFFGHFWLFTNITQLSHCTYGI